ncbi:MAG: DUF262 domain-containing HNH endonuclease family protein [Melioribacteraceae bacterium]|nr:DUF262 domain-containing HNH endonuclease family protein [Melioribacteraceae bacterium]MCF8353904.1 DUF262 domain-containing HNH endonuclease family protein [Melioribacteraceae bacterium]MCF8392661.1 DUF262 domain-containing HNH endonuclease family protein [Melioribacteraceae bacterium]MCF8417682.1 DUF262 domain-containing HNH endonuclease family protein [Melioribacteraceae bacterium]
MNDPIPLDSVFKEKIFRIPDFQRGFAWHTSDTRNPLRDFWEDLVNLSEDRSHYTGVLTLREVTEEVEEEDSEYWLVEDHSYKMYHIVDGQQRLTTFIIFLQSLIELISSLEDNKGKSYDEIFLTDTLKLSSIIGKFIYRDSPGKKILRTYKFGYEVDNPSYQYLRYRIFNEDGEGEIEETFYTLNLRNAKKYFSSQLKNLYEIEGLEGLEYIYKKLTKKFLFNEYIIKDEFDVFVAFETMNNRGKKLSDLELLKNRLIYLTTLYPDKELKKSERSSIRENINLTWKEIYHQLGRNEKKPLNDDDFLRAHWIMYFKYSREKGNDYIRYLLDEKFTPQNIHKKKEVKVELDSPIEQKTDFDIDSADEENETIQTISVSHLGPEEIKNYILSLRSSAKHWFNTFYPELSESLSETDKLWLDRLNRIGMGYFRPLVMSILLNVKSSSQRERLFTRIERFIFVVFSINRAYRNYGDSEFYNAARELNNKDIDVAALIKKIENREKSSFDSDGFINTDSFRAYLAKKFSDNNVNGYYTWNGLRYLLYEYEMDLLNEGRQQKVYWTDLINSPKDSVTVEHILPQTLSTYWEKIFSGFDETSIYKLSASLGNMLLLSKSINSSLQNDTFENKKKPKYSSKSAKLRNGYSDGSHSEIEVSEYTTWDAEAIKKRGLKLLSFIEKRWAFKFPNEEVKEDLLFPGFINT